MTIEDQLLSAYGYQQFPLATSYLVGNNSELDVTDVFWSVLFIMLVEGNLLTIEDRSLSVHGYQLLPLDN